VTKVDSIDLEQRLGALVAERPAVTVALECLGLDYCCGGGQTLSEASRRRGLDPATVAVVLERFADTAAGRRAEPHDLRGATVPGLCDHIVSAHHARLRRELPRIEEQLATVVRVHGDGHPQLRDLERLFVALAGELREHLRTEEASLFPAARALAAGERGDAGILRLLDEHRAEHAAAGDALAALRELTNSYDSDTALCGTHRRLLEALEASELDLHQHVHEENNLLFPRVLALASR
jgi:regulator of cell morphogenesis and NO signaling